MNIDEFNEIKKTIDGVRFNTYKEHLNSEVVQFIVLAALKKGGKIKVSNILMAVNGFNYTTKEVLENHKLDLIFFGSIDESKNTFQLNKSDKNDFLSYIDYDKPVVTNLNFVYLFIGLAILVFIVVAVFLIPIALVISVPVILIMAIFKKNLRGPLLYIFTLIGLVIATLTYMKIDLF